MVPLGAVEDFVARLWPDSAHAVVAAPDAKRGEQLVLITERRDAARVHLTTAARDFGLPEIFVPRTIVTVTRVPVLSTGRTDYVGAAQLVAQERLAS